MQVPQVVMVAVQVPSPSSPNPTAPVFELTSNAFDELSETKQDVWKYGLNWLSYNKMVERISSMKFVW